MVEWSDEAIEGPHPASEDAVRGAERELRVRFPADFLAVATIRQGAEPIPAGIEIPGFYGTSVFHLLHFEEEPWMSNIVNRLFPLEGVLDKGVIPFAEDIGRDVFCFNYRHTPNTPSVDYLSVDTGLVELAPSFTDFIALLRER